MIELSADTACMLYLIVAIAIVLFQWYRSNKRLSKKNIVSYSLTTKRCEFCGHSFLATNQEKFFRCPECHCLNQK